MKVKELIQRLQNYEPNTEVTFAHPDSGWPYGIKGIEDRFFMKNKVIVLMDYEDR